MKNKYTLIIDAGYLTGMPTLPRHANEIIYVQDANGEWLTFEDESDIIASPRMTEMWTKHIAQEKKRDKAFQKQSIKDLHNGTPKREVSPRMAKMLRKHAVQERKWKKAFHEQAIKDLRNGTAKAAYPKKVLEALEKSAE